MGKRYCTDVRCNLPSHHEGPCSDKPYFPPQIQPVTDPNRIMELARQAWRTLQEADKPKLGIVLLLIAAASLHAETVYFTPNGKTYCTVKTCLSLSRSKVVLSAEESEAIAHGLTRAKTDTKSTKTTKAAKNAAFGKVVK